MDRKQSVFSRADLQAAALCCGAACLSGVLVLLACLFPRELRWLSALLAVTVACAVFVFLCVKVFARVANPFRRDMVNLDQLTRLKNRNAYEVDLRNLEARRKHMGMGVILIDLDNLKKVNDAKGHAAGDRYLRLAADILWDTPSAWCAAYRVGGDEFVLLVQDTRRSELEALAGDILRRFELVKEKGWRLSAGTAAFDPSKDRSLRDTCFRADQNMYTQKRAHRREEAEL